MIKKPSGNEKPFYPLLMKSTVTSSSPALFSLVRNFYALQCAQQRSKGRIFRQRYHKDEINTAVEKRASDSAVSETEGFTENEPRLENKKYPMKLKYAGMSHFSALVLCEYRAYADRKNF